MSINAIRYTFSAALFSVATIVTQAQSPSIDPTLAAQIAAIPAIDNHAHPLLSPPAYATDRNFDALPVDNMEPETDPANLRPTLPARLQGPRDRAPPRARAKPHAASGAKNTPPTSSTAPTSPPN